jgi:hypothetical protein
VSLPLKRAVLKSAAPRPIHRRSERHRGSQSKSAPRTVRPQQSGLEQDSGRPDTLVGDAPRRFAERAENWKFASHHHTGMTVRACDDVAGVSAHRFHVDGRRSAWSATCRKQGRIAGRAGVSGHPHHEGLPDQGLFRSPSLPFPWTRCFPSSGHSCRSSREARPGCVSPRRASRQCGAGERGAPPRGVEEDHYAPFFEVVFERVPW